MAAVRSRTASALRLSACSTILQRALTRRSAMRRAFSISLAVAGAVCLAAQVGPQAQPKRTVNFYNWSDYIDPTVLTDFQRETGIAVTYDTFDSNDMLETKLLAGKSG